MSTEKPNFIARLILNGIEEVKADGLPVTLDSIQDKLHVTFHCTDKEVIEVMTTGNTVDDRLKKQPTLECYDRDKEKW